MIDLVKSLPFEDCEDCQCFEPNFRSSKMFGDDKCLVNEIEVHCSSAPICREIRKHLKREAENNGTDK